MILLRFDNSDDDDGLDACRGLYILFQSFNYAFLILFSLYCIQCWKLSGILNPDSKHQPDFVTQSGLSVHYVPTQLYIRLSGEIHITKSIQRWKFLARPLPPWPLPSEGRKRTLCNIEKCKWRPDELTSARLHFLIRWPPVRGCREVQVLQYFGSVMSQCNFS